MAASNPNPSGIVGTSSAEIRPAERNDVTELFELKRDALGRHLEYTIYQAPASIREVFKIVNGEEPGHELAVLTHHGALAGYYHAVRSGDEFLLSYIAVGRKHRSRGLGKALLNHFHNRASDQGCKRTSLTVFAFDGAAHQWYRHEGYETTQESWMCRFLVPQSGPKALTRLVCGPEDLAEAVRNENAFGFSKLVCEFAGAAATIGLIGGHSCRVISPAVASEPMLRHALRWAAAQKRHVLIASLAEAPTPKWTIAGSELSIHMARPVPTKFVPAGRIF